jgi:hypothetical protein
VENNREGGAATPPPEEPADAPLSAAPPAALPSPTEIPPLGVAAGEPGPSFATAATRIPGVFFSPVATFDSIARRPGWVLPLLLWTIVSVTVTTLLIPRIDFEKLMRARLERGGQTVPEERIQAAVAMQKRLAPFLYNAIAVVTPALFSVLVAGVFWGAYKSFGWDLTFAQSMGVTTHGFLPGVLGSLLFIPVLLKNATADPAALGDMLHSNLGYLVPRSSAVLHALLQSVDLFSFWTLALLVIGFSAATKVSRKTSAVIVIVVWVLFVLGKAGFAAIFS